MKLSAERDGYPADPESIYMTTGASGGVSNMLKVVIANPKCGVLIPIPQYPLYTAELALNAAKAVPYYLIEEDGWGVNVQQMRDAVHKARDEGTDVRAIVIINPGNPTGQCLSVENMQDIVKLAYEEKLVLMADEVYQTNVFDKKNRPFYSFKKLIKEMGEPYSNNLELVSFHSLSKGQIGECGRRGGFFEIVNFDEDAVAQVYKLASIQLCSGLQGQIGVDLMVDPPKEGDESYKQYAEEISSIHTTLQQRSIDICKAFEKMEGVTCNPAEVGGERLLPNDAGADKSARRAQCIYSRRSKCRQGQLTLLRRQRGRQTPSTACSCSRRPVSVLCQALALDKRKAHYTSERRSWLLK